MRQLSWDEFANSAGTTYQVARDDRSSIEVTLETAEELPSSGRAAGAFRLEFRGPLEPILPQAIYTFQDGEDCFDIFIVPIGREETGTLYEAVFC